MATIVKLKKSAVAGKVPLSTDLEYGELALNYADGKLYFKNTSNTVQSISAGALGVDSAATQTLIDSAYLQSKIESIPTLDLRKGLIVGGRIPSNGYNSTTPPEIGYFRKDGISLWLHNNNQLGGVNGYETSDSNHYRTGILFGHNQTGQNAQDLAFIQYHPRGEDNGNITGYSYNAGLQENAKLVIGVGNDQEDHLILQVRDADGVKVLTASNTGTDSIGNTNNEYTVWHAGNADSLGTVLITSVVDAAYVQARQAATAPAGVDSAATIALIDSAYVQARQDYSFSSLTGTPTTISGYGITDAFDGAYSSLTGAPTNVSSFTNDAGYTTYDSANTTGMLSGYATQSYVTTQINNLIDGAPGTLDTLNEIAAALNDDDSAYATLVNLIGAKVDSASVMGIIDSAVNLAFINNLDVNAGTLDGQDGTYYLNYNNFTNKPTAADFRDSAFVASIASQTTSPTDSASVAGIVDSAFLSTLVNNNYIATIVDSAYVALRVGSFAENFGTVAVVGDLSIDATTGGDTITFAAGSGVSISTNTSQKRVTISATANQVFDFGTFSQPVGFTLDMGAF